MEESILEKIYKSGLKLLEPLTPEETYETIVKEAIKLVNGSYGTLTFLIEDDFKDVYTTLPIKVKRRKYGYTYKVYRSMEVLLIHNQEIEEHAKRYPEMVKMGIKSVILIPLAYKKKALGVLIVNTTKKEHFTEKELHILKLFGSLATLAIRKTQLYDEAKAALGTRDLFISMAAHELRTPLTTISGYSQLLLNKLKNNGSAETRWAEQLQYECIRLSHLVNELLEINRIKTGELSYNLKECDLRMVIDRVLKNFAFIHPNHRVVFDDKLGEVNLIVIADFDKLIQVVMNLLDNSASYSSSDDPILLRLKQHLGVFILQIKDNGVGIDGKDLPFIFDRFYRGNGSKKEGLGLGLFTVKNIVERIHGSISVKSKKFKGSIFELRLPKANIEVRNGY